MINIAEKQSREMVRDGIADLWQVVRSLHSSLKHKELEESMQLLLSDKTYDKWGLDDEPPGKSCFYYGVHKYRCKYLLQAAASRTLMFWDLKTS